MNIYPVWWDTTLTIYNKFTDPQTQVITWYKHVLTNCFWKYIGNKITIGETIIETNDTICRIPIQQSGEIAVAGIGVVGVTTAGAGSLYLDRYIWESLPNDKMADFFTLGVGDIIIKGEVDDIIDEYTSGHRSSDIMAKYKRLQGCIMIEAFSINTGIGRNSEHYYVKGV